MSLNNLFVVLARWLMAAAAVLALGACSNGGVVTTGTGGRGCGMSITSSEGLWLGSGRFVGGAAGDSIVGMIGPSDLLILDLTGTDPLNAPIPGYFWFGNHSGTTGTFTKYTGTGPLLGQGPLTIGLSAYLNLTLGSNTALIPMCPISSTVGNLYDHPTVNAAGDDLIVGTWQFQIGQTYQLQYIFDSSGTINGTDTQSCLYTGNWIADARHKNLYRIDNMTLSNGSPNACDGKDANGNTVRFAGGGYKGFAMFFDSSLTRAPATLWIAVANGEVAFFSKLSRTSTPPAFP